MAKISRNQRIAGLRKSRSGFVVKDGIRKMRTKSIRKFQDSYNVGLAYVGLMELTKSHNYEGEYNGWMVKDTAIGPINVHLNMKVRTRVTDKDFGEHRARSVRHAHDRSSVWGDGYDDDNTYDYTGVSDDNLGLWGENMAGINIVDVSGSLNYTYETREGYNKNLYSKNETAYSVEDFLDLITRDSEEAWGEVTILIGEIGEHNAEYDRQAVAFPKQITLTAPDGTPKTIPAKSDGKWEGTIRYAEEDINCELNIEVLAVTYENGEFSSERAWSVDRSLPVAYYHVEVVGEIEDKNTQVSSKRNEYQPDHWFRRYQGEGAETLEGAIAIIESNCAEVYQEFKDYVASEREYKTFGHGVGYQRTTENVNPWEYNYGDSVEDSRYESYQNGTSYMDYIVEGSGWGDALDNAVDKFKEEYFGQYYSKFDCNHDWSMHTYYFHPRYEELPPEVAEIFNNKSREDVERACRMTRCSLIDYVDPTHFTIQMNISIEMSARKGMAKSKKPRSFNAMVQSVRARNHQKQGGN